MKYTISNLIMDLGDEDYISAIGLKLRIKRSSISNLQLLKKSVDARHGVKFTLTIAFDCDADLSNKAVEPFKEKINIIDNIQKSDNNLKVCIVGSGPAGLFCAYALAKAGIKTVIIERGDDLKERKISVQNFWDNKILNENSNVQFGLGGAGTFSDGKLTSGINNENIYTIFNTFNKFGAHDDIMYSSTPHIGTDVLETVISNFRDELSSLGVEWRFKSTMTDIVVNNSKISGIEVMESGIIKTIMCDKVVLAIGHSSRDTFEMLKRRGVQMERKAFAMGVRIEHSKEMIDLERYGIYHTHRDLNAADYKMYEHLDGGRTVYTFCMCPGGDVIAASSEKETVVTNGMSNSRRDGNSSNSALLVNVNPTDFESDDVLAGIEFQRKWEQKAYKIHNNYVAPCQNTLDFMENRIGNHFDITPTYSCLVKQSNLRDCLPDFITAGLLEGIKKFGKKIKGFDSSGVLTAIESRSSSPVRILRNESRESNINGLYPCGEGAGYAGGIVSAASDGLTTALQICKMVK
ncbi:MAG: FAD-dependent oxidoreductase [Clostridia bacterium]